MSFLKKPFQKLKELNTSSSGAIDSSDVVPDGFLGTPRRSLSGKFLRRVEESSGPSSPDSRWRSRDLLQEEKYRRSIDKERTKSENKKKQQLSRIAAENFLKEGPEEITKLYKPYSMNMS